MKNALPPLGAGDCSRAQTMCFISGFAVYPGDRWILEVKWEYVIAVEVYDTDSTKVYLSDVNMCLVNNQQLPRECHDELCYRYLALIRKWERERRELTLAVLLSQSLCQSLSHTHFYLHFIHTSFLTVLQTSMEMHNSVSVCRRCIGFSLEEDTIFTDLCQFAEPENNSLFF